MHSLQTELDCLVIQFMDRSQMGRLPSHFMTESPVDWLHTSPSEATNFSTEAFEVLGDYTVVCEFHANMVMSPFNETLHQYAFQKSGDVITQGMLKYVIPMDPDKIDWISTVAREDGLLDPKGDRPSFGEAFVQMVQALTIAQQESDMPVEMEPTSSQTPLKTFMPFPTSVPSQSNTQSGYSCVNKTQQSRPKAKPKNKGGQASEPILKEKPDTEEVDLDLNEFPDLLPPFFDLPKKILKRILAINPDSRDTERKDALKRGHAMKRLDFDVIQTASSSVRFDPPEKTARPISFHRYVAISGCYLRLSYVKSYWSPVKKVLRLDSWDFPAQRK
ncbi:hypothetical protein DFS33DRAFT_1483868 [Desarmillaria ectypa]|nr:hypothetical protein DFS33DRAFT_1483868 [Desarmillaria ectypa]